MDWKYLYTSFEGRIARKQFWFGVLGFIVVGIVLSLIANLITGGFSMTPATDAESAMAAFRAACLANIVVFVVLAWPSAALLIKRRHDRGSAGTEVWVYLAISLLGQLLTLVGFDYSAVEMPGTEGVVIMPGIIASGIGIIIFVFAAYLLVVCGFLKGDTGENAYGPDPLAGRE